MNIVSHLRNIPTPNIHTPKLPLKSNLAPSNARYKPPIECKICRCQLRFVKKVLTIWRLKQGK